MKKGVCRYCGSASIVLNVEIDGTGYKDIEATFDEHGKLSEKAGWTQNNYDTTDTEIDYECGECGERADDLSELVCVEGQDAGGKLCCCGHSLREHPESKDYDRRLYTRGRRSCGEPNCGCWEFETDAALATVVREGQAA
jgi:hypothetical protein